MSKATKTLLIIAIAIFIGFFVIGGWVAGKYNLLVDTQTNVESQWSQVENQYQRRADLVPQLVSTVQGAAGFEQETLTAVTEARTKWLNASGSGISEQYAAGQELDSAISRLLLTFENYPTLTATENFQTLQAQLEGTENRVAVARKNFIDSVNAYNRTVRRFPNNLIAGLFGFEVEEFFEGTEGSENAPEVDFSNFTDNSTSSTSETQE